MCLNSIWFFYSFFFLSKYLLISVHLVNKCEQDLYFLKKYIVHNNFFLTFKVFVVRNFTKMYLHKNVVFSRSNSLARSVLVVSKLFRVTSYKRYFSFFFLNFFHEQSIIFFSFKLFFLEFSNFMSYIRDANFAMFMQPLLLYYQEKKNRKKFLKILSII
jgi:hypothetical protein